MKNPFQNAFLHVSLGDKVLFVKHMAIAIRSGMTLLSAVQMIRMQTRSGSLKKILDIILVDLDNGIFLSTSLEKFHNIFGDLFINIVRVGEASGTLTENLNYLGEEMKKRDELRKKVRGALIYPAVILFATLGIASAMIIFVFPKILPVFQSLKVKLPFTTVLFINISDFVIHKGHYLVLGIIVVIICWTLLMRLPAVRFVIHRIILTVPLFGTITKNLNMANIARTMGLLLKSGIKIVESVSITADTTANPVYKKELKEVAEVVKTGEFISRHLLRNPALFPSIMVNMISVGEETGNLPENLAYLAEYYETEEDDFVKNISSVIEPVLLLVMGLIVGFIAISIISPIYQITQSLTL